MAMFELQWTISGRAAIEADDADEAEKARAELSRAGAESVDAARDEWWVGLRDAEREHYTEKGGNFDTDEAKYRLGFEAAMRPDCRGKSCADMQPKLNERYGEDANAQPFREGYDRGQHYLINVDDSYRSRQDQETAVKSQSQRAA